MKTLESHKTNYKDIHYEHYNSATAYTLAIYNNLSNNTFKQKQQITTIISNTSQTAAVVKRIQYN